MQSHDAGCNIYRYRMGDAWIADEAPEIEVAVHAITSAGPGPLDYAFRFADPAPRPGTQAYWIKVVQEDGHMAWNNRPIM